MMKYIIMRQVLITWNTLIVEMQRKRQRSCVIHTNNIFAMKEVYRGNMSFLILQVKTPE